jgi:hypothetical protein
VSLAVARPFARRRSRGVNAAPPGLLRRIRARLAAPRLDARLAMGEDPHGDAALACRSVQLVSERSRRRLARGLERACSAHRAALSAAVPAHGRAVELARPALQQLATALLWADSVEPRGVALATILLTEPCSALYQPACPEELDEAAREAVAALGGDR